MDEAVNEYKKRRQKRLDTKAVEQYRIRRDARVKGRMDADGDEENRNNGGNNGGNKGGGHGNTKLPFGLCQREGIKIDPGWSPSDAWDALAEKGYSAKETYKELKETGKVERKGGGGSAPKKTMTVNEASDYLTKVKDQEKQRAHDISVTNNDLIIAKQSRSSLGKQCEKLTFEIERMEANIKAGVYSESSLGRIRDMIDFTKQNLKKTQEDFEEAKKTERELQGKANKLSSGVDASEKEKIKEALKVKYPKDWESCERVDDSLEMARMLGIADGGQEKFIDTVESMVGIYRPKYLKPTKMDSALGSDDIVKKIAGGDETGGSCATLCVAYIANKMGYNVLDFRGGESRQAIASKCTSLMRGVGGHIEIDRDGYKAANRNLAMMEEGKEYWFEAGSHASIVRKKDEKYEYLEMQSGGENGWFPLDDRVLKNRFKTHHTKTFHGFRTDISSHIVDIDDVMKRSAFPVLFGLLNTAADKQKKGRYGHER